VCIAKRNESQFQADKLLKVSLTEGRYPWGVVLATRHVLHLQATKVQKTNSHKANYFWASSGEQFRIAFSRRLSAENEPSRSQIPLGHGCGDLIQIAFLVRQSAEYEFTRNQVPLRREFQDSPNIHFQAVKMLKINHKEILNRGFHDLAEIAFSYHQNAKNDLARKFAPCLAPWFSRLGIDRIVRRKNVENDLARTYVPLKHGFHYSAEIESSDRQIAENVKTRIHVILNRWFS